MILKRFYDEKLAQASYLIGCAATGEALVVDANRDVEPYVRAAQDEGVSITHVTETHIHADYVSGSRELAARTGAKLYLSDEGGTGWRYAFADADGAVLLKHGDGFRVGNIRIDVLHTPGHTPEHLTFLVTDGAAADRPIGALTGDFVFVGDVGRPDLLEKAAGVSGTMEPAARTLFRSLQAFKAQPDYLQIWPGHGAGSACGKGLSSIPHSTMGYERLFNWGLGVEDEDTFVGMVLAGQPEPPRYFAEMKRINREGPPVLGALPTPRRVPDARLAEVLRGGGTVIDTRPAEAFAAAHVPGTINIPLNRSFTTWAGSLIPYGRPFHLMLDGRSPGAIAEVAHDLAMIGLEEIEGYFDVEAIDRWAVGDALQRVPQVGAEELRARVEGGSAFLLDVRGAAEWEAGHLPGTAPSGGAHGRHVPLGSLAERLEDLPRDRPLIVYCQGGARSAIAASVLQAHGFDEVYNFTPGYDGWRASGLPVERRDVVPAGAVG
jgi:hydroxyacylglutathione hydrolase